MVKERYVIGKNFNTKDWWVYDNNIDKYIYFCDSEEEAKEYVKRRCKLLNEIRNEIMKGY